MQPLSPSATLQRDDRQALRELIRTLADEAGELAQSADQLQLLFGGLMADPPVRPTDASERAQVLDSLVQRLQGLETFLAALGTRRLDNVSTDAVLATQGLSLTSQARRFSAQQITSRAATTYGDCDLF